MIPFAFWSFATTRDILPSEFGAAETRWDRGGGSLGTHRGRRSKNFFVEGEQRYWVHVAIDRFTGQVIDKQIEVVNE